MSARITFTDWETTLGPQWMGDFGDRQNLVPGGALLAASQFSRADEVTVQMSADAVRDATTLNVDALSGPVPAGTILDFRTADFTVTADGNAIATATSITVDALPGAVPAGTILDFEDAGKFALVTADAAAGATSLTVEALPEQIDDDDEATYRGQNKFAVTSAAAAEGATSITVEALGEQINDNETAVYEGVGLRHVPSGTIIGRTFAERAAGTGFGPVDFTASTSVDDDEVYILAFDVEDADDNPECELFRHGGLVKENLLPDWSTLDSILQAWVRNNHNAILGQQ